MFCEQCFLNRPRVSVYDAVACGIYETFPLLFKFIYTLLPNIKSGHDIWDIFAKDHTTIKPSSLMCWNHFALGYEVCYLNTT